MKLKHILIIIGVFLILDGLLSLYYGNACLDACLNNSFLGNAVRWIRFGLGIVLVYIANRR